MSKLKSLLLSFFILTSTVFAESHHNELDHVVEALLGQMESLIFISEAKKATDPKSRTNPEENHPDREYDQIIKDSRHVQEDLLKALTDYKTNPDMPKLIAACKTVEKHIDDLVEHLDHFKDHTYDAYSLILIDVVSFFKLIIGADHAPGGGASRVSCIYSLESSFGADFPKVVVECLGVPAHYKRWKLTWVDQLGEKRSKVDNIHRAAGADQFRAQVGAVYGAEKIKFNLSLIGSTGRPVPVKLQAK